METYLTQIANYLLTQSWQIATLVVIIAIINWILKNKSSHVRYLLWMIVLAKCLMPPFFSVPVAILPKGSPHEQMSTVPVTETTTAANNMFRPEATERDVPQSIQEPEFSMTVISETVTELTIRQLLGISWLIGMFIYITVVLIKALRTELWLRRKKKPLPAILQVRIEDVFCDLRLKQFPKMWIVESIGQPFVWGVLRGGIYLPYDFTKVNNNEQQHGILGHELCHIIRFDAMINLLQIITQGIFWFHPFVWWANKKIRAEREKCCDEMTIARLGARAREYSKAIVNILISEHKNNQNIPSLAIVGPVKNIEERIKIMLKPGKKFYKRPGIVTAAAIFVTALLIVPTALVLTTRIEANSGSKPPIQIIQSGNSRTIQFSKEAAEQFKRNNPPIGQRAMIHRSVDLMRTYTPAVIDGIAENTWSHIREEILTNKIAAPKSSDKSVSATYKAMWDNENLYVFVQVTDEARQSDSPDFTQDDSIEIFIDADNSKTGDYDDNDYHFYFKWNGENPVIGLANGKKVPDGIKYKLASLNINKNYNLEVKFPWAVIGTRAYPNAKIGFDVHVNDDDDGGDRDCKVTWCDRGDLAWQNTCLFGTAELTGLVGWWKFDETEGTIAADSSGNANYGKLIGDAKWKPAGGKTGGAIYLDGDGDYVIITNKHNFDITESITVSVWVKTEPVNDDWATIVGKGNAWYLYSGFPEDNYHFQINNMTPSNPRKYEAGQWHHVVGVYDSRNRGQIRTYIDGEFDVSRQAEEIIRPSTGINISDLPVCIGENLQYGGREWKGLIDDVRIYNYALNEDEISALYKGK